MTNNFVFLTLLISVALYAQIVSIKVDSRVFAPKEEDTQEMREYLQHLKEVRKKIDTPGYFRTEFNEEDAQHVGTLVESQVFDLLTKMAEKEDIRPPTKMRTEKFFKAADTNNKGKITYDQFIKQLKTYLDNLIEEQKTKIQQASSRR